MHIQVTREFGGRLTSERRIYPGEYDLDDPALFGAGQYLLDNGFAVALDALVVDATDWAFEVSGAEGEIPDGSVVTYWASESEAVDYSDFTIAELKALLDERGVDYSDAKRKDDYIALAEGLA